MSFFAPLLERREFSLARFADWMDRGYTTSQSGVDVNDQSALTWPAVYGCVQVLSQDEAKTPLQVFRRLGRNGKDGREEATDHPLSGIFKYAANPYTTAYQFKQTMQKDLCVRGNAYALIYWDERGRTSSLWHRKPQYMCVEVKDGALRYKYDPCDGTPAEYYSYDQVFHLKGLSNDGIIGLSPVEIFREGIGLALAQQRHGLKTMQVGIRQPFGIKAPIDSNPENAIRLGTEFAKAFGGVDNAGKVPFFYGGMEPVPLGFSNADAQYIESMQASFAQACSIWRVAPTKIMDFLRATFSNITEVNISHVNDTLRPHQENWEQEIHLKLLSEEERLVYYVEHNNYDLLKGTPRERAEIENSYVASGVSQINEVRGSHNWNPVPGGDRNRVQMQNVPLEAADALAVQQPPQNKEKK